MLNVFVKYFLIKTYDDITYNITYKKIDKNFWKKYNKREKIKGGEKWKEGKNFF